MSNFSTLFGGGGISAMYSIFVAESSGSFTTPVKGTYRITAIGGGGGGAPTGGGGGGAGGFAQSIVELPAGVTISYTVGAGGSPNAAGNNTT
ncbi:MAG: glycine-rich domain-containing protein, partial [Pseudomonas sp.]|uniref:glycine-rich domain-containing protein n=1 Tax=Pseudomonas sp. TaxID=306 RepID=UPI00391AF1EB